MPTLELERQLRKKGFSLVAGVDEAGRGPLAGPVVAAAVILPAGIDESAHWLKLIDDSKKLTSKQRFRALDRIQQCAVSIGIGSTGPQEIDTIGILEATKQAMLRAIGNLSVQPQYLLIDFVPPTDWSYPFETLVRGDSRCYSIAAASIVAKVTRDRLMEEMDSLYPCYDFARHKGYPTPAHKRLLAMLGPSPIHRRSFLPVKLVCNLKVVS